MTTPFDFSFKKNVKKFKVQLNVECKIESVASKTWNNIPALYDTVITFTSMDSMHINPIKYNSIYNLLRLILQVIGCVVSFSSHQLLIMTATLAATDDYFHYGFIRQLFNLQLFPIIFRISNCSAINCFFPLFFLLQRQNIPKDYRIPVHYVPKEEVRYGGVHPQLIMGNAKTFRPSFCWLVTNICQNLTTRFSILTLPTWIFITNILNFKGSSYYYIYCYKHYVHTLVVTVPLAPSWCQLKQLGLLFDYCTV